MVVIAIAAAAGWLTLYLGCAAITSDRHMRRGIRRLRLDGGRQRGLTRARLPQTALAMLYLSGTVVAGFAAAAVGEGHATRWVGATLLAGAVLIALASLTGMLGRNDRLTVAGAALAAWAARVTAQQAMIHRE